VKPCHMLYLALFVVGCTQIAIKASFGAEPLDLAILTDTKPIAARASEALDLRILAEPVAMAARPVEALDLSILIDAPTAKPMVKPSAESQWKCPHGASGL